MLSLAHAQTWGEWISVGDGLNVRVSRGPKLDKINDNSYQWKWQFRNTSDKNLYFRYGFGVDRSVPMKGVENVGPKSIRDVGGSVLGSQEKLWFQWSNEISPILPVGDGAEQKNNSKVLGEGLDKSLLIRWSAENNTIDSVSNKAGEAKEISYVNGIVGQAFKFSTPLSKITFPIPEKLRSLRSLSISGWMSIQNEHLGGNLTGGILSFRDNSKVQETRRAGFPPNGPSANPDFLSLQIVSRELDFQIDSLSTKNYSGVHAPMMMPYWNHFAAVLDIPPKKLRLYINGDLVDEVAVDIPPFAELVSNSSAQIVIGNTERIRDDPRVIDELEIYDKALTSEEIRGLFVRYAGEDVTRANRHLPMEIYASEFQPRSMIQPPSEAEILRKVLPENTRLLFWSWDGTGCKLGKWSDGRFQVESLTLPGMTPYSVNLRSDGKTVALSRPDGLHIYNLETRKRLRVSDILGMKHTFAWSPDGEKLAFIMSPFSSGSTGQSADDIFSFDFKTGTLMQLTSSANRKRGLAWSPDGRKIAYSVWTSAKIEERGIFTMNADGSNTERIAIKGPTLFGDLSWSPDGSQLVVASQIYSGSLRIINRKGTDSPFVATGGRAAHPAWLSNNYIVFGNGMISTDVNEVGISAVRPDGTGRVEVVKNLVGSTSMAVCATERKEVSEIDWSKAEGVTITSHPPTTPVTNPPQPTKAPSTLAVDTQSIFLHSNRDGNDEIYSLREDGKTATRLTNNPAPDGGAIPSPDGKRIAFTSKRDGNLEIYVMNADGSNLSRVTNNNASDVASSWSADSGQIAFYSNRDGNFDIFLTSVDGRTISQLTQAKADDIQPSISPDGIRVAFSSNRNGNYDIYVMNLKERVPVRFTTSAVADHEPSWSPDGQFIVWSRKEGERNEDIYLMKADGTEQKRLTDYNGRDVRPTFTADGKTIVFASDRDGNMEIYSMKVDGTGVVRLTDNSASDNDPFAVGKISKP
jgi:Tol biopolymer transport system component